MGQIIICPMLCYSNGTDNYRGICLLSVPWKVLTKAQQERMKIYVENDIAEEQAWFRQGRGTIDQIFVIRQIAEKYTEYNKSHIQ